MNKITYKLAGLFTLRKYKQGNLCHETYTNPMLSTIRSSIIASIIKLDGVEKAKELFHKVKNEIIYIQYQDNYSLSNQRLKRYTNTYYNTNVEDMEKWSSFLTVGCKQFANVDKIVFYIGNSIPNIEVYLKNIDWIGSADSMVYLESIEEAKELNNILIKWNEIDDADVHEMYDWNKVSGKTNFENIYMFDKKYKRTDIRELFCVSDIVLPK